MILVITVFYYSTAAFAQISAQLDQNNTVFSTSSLNTSSPLFNGFESQALEGNVYLKWYVKDKNNSKIYLVERSKDGISFEITSVLKETGGKYDIEILDCFVDKNPIMGYSYYRIAVSDEFGNKEYSPVNLVYNEASNSKESLYSNDVFAKNESLIK